MAALSYLLTHLSFRTNSKPPIAEIHQDHCAQSACFVWPTFLIPTLIAAARLRFEQARAFQMSFDNKPLAMALSRSLDQCPLRLGRRIVKKSFISGSPPALRRLIAEKLKIKVDQVRNEIETPLIKIYGNMYAGFEEIALSEGEVLNDYNFSTEMKKAILDIVAISIQISTVNVSADLGVRSFAPDGVEHVKSLLKSAEETANRFTEVNSKITTLGSPQYRINLEGRSYDEVLEVLDSIESELNTISKSLNVEYVIERKKN